MGWCSNALVSLRRFSKNHVDVLVTNANEGKKWRFMGFYGVPFANERLDTWNLLCRLA